MLLFIIYYLISPKLFILLLLFSPFNKKIRIVLQQQKKSVKKIKEKLKTNKKKIIIHAASAGEYEQIKPLLRIIDKDTYFVIITCMSPTIYESIKNDQLSDAYCYHPFDLPWLSKRFFKLINPSIYLTTRHDVWPMHLYTAKKMNIKTIIINANLYPKSKRLKWYFINLTKYIFNLFDLIMVPSEQIQNIFKKQLQINDVYIASDTRFDQIMYRKNNSNGIAELEPIYKQNNIIFGSISYEDLKLFNIDKEGKNILSLVNDKNSINWIIIVPHEIDINLINKIEEKFPNAIRFSKIKDIKLEPFGFLIVDKVGILPELYKYTKIAYIGGGFGKGVHSTTEPLIYNNIVCYGPNIDLLDEAKDMINKKCGFIINTGKEITEICWQQFTENECGKTAKQEIEKNIQKYINKKEHSAEKMYEIIKEYA